MIASLEKCRLCKSTKLTSVLNLGNPSYTGIFPRNRTQKIPKAPLLLVKCNECDLVQLGHHFDMTQLYGEHYGYRSGLIPSMVQHLHNKVEKIKSLITLSSDDYIIDIGSNDATLLHEFNSPGIHRIGIDPSGEKFRSYYGNDIKLITQFFPCEEIFSLLGNKKAKVITSIAIFYDLEDPVDFAQKISQILMPDGVWVFEQSYMPSMIKMKSYDTICHEHLEYYGLKQILNILNRAKLKIIDIEFNAINGGSFSITSAHLDSKYSECKDKINTILDAEAPFHTFKIWEDFTNHVEAHRANLRKLLDEIKKDNKTIFGYGASTKGNALLQFCGLTKEELPYIAEINDDKFGAYTPGTEIPIISEKEAREMNPDYYLVLPWHFKDGILKREQTAMQSGTRFIFPLPEIEVVG